jgi:hypothetical protein
MTQVDLSGKVADNKQEDKFDRYLLDYEKAQENAKRIFVEKNKIYNAAFFTENEDLLGGELSGGAFYEITTRYNRLTSSLKYRNTSGFDVERFKRDLLHLANYALMLYMFCEYLPKNSLR